MKKMNREEAIQYLCQKDFEYINSSDGAGLELLDSILADGFKGYGNYTDEELKSAVIERKEMEKMGI